MTRAIYPVPVAARGEAHERVQALTVTELNPAHAAADSGALARLCGGIAGALGDPDG